MAPCALQAVSRTRRLICWLKGGGAARPVPGGRALQAVSRAPCPCDLWLARHTRANTPLWTTLVTYTVCVCACCSRRAVGRLGQTIPAACRANGLSAERHSCGHVAEHSLLGTPSLLMHYEARGGACLALNSAPPPAFREHGPATRCVKLRQNAAHDAGAATATRSGARSSASVLCW